MRWTRFGGSEATEPVKSKEVGLLRLQMSSSLRRWINRNAGPNSVFCFAISDVAPDAQD